MPGDKNGAHANICRLGAASVIHRYSSPRKECFVSSGRGPDISFGCGVLLVMLVCAVIGFKPFTGSEGWQLSWPKEDYLLIAGAICVVMAVVATLVGRESS